MNSSLFSASSRRGFTLIELLTVIAIIGILAAIIIPTVGKVRDSARSGQCTSNLRQVAMALRLFADDNRGALPAAYDANGQNGVAGDKDWSSAIKGYLPKINGGENAGGTRHPVMTCPSHNYSDVNSIPPSHTYAMAPAATGLNPAQNDNDLAARRNLLTIRNPSLGILLFEARLNDPTFKTPLPALTKRDIPGSFTSPTDNARNQVQFWHGGKNRTNIAFADVSVRGFAVSEFNDRYPRTAWDTTTFKLAAGL